VLRRERELCLHRRDRLADVARLELGELLAVRDDGVGERVEEARALVRRRLPPRAVQGFAGRGDRAVDVLLARHRNTGERFAGRRFDELPQLARGRLGRLAADEQPELSLDRHGHRSQP